MKYLNKLKLNKLKLECLNELKLNKLLEYLNELNVYIFDKLKY